MAGNHRVLTRQLTRFAVTGAINTIVGLAAIAFGQTILSLGPYWANAFGYLIGLSCSYVLNSRWTFGAGAGSPGRLLRFIAVFAVAYVANLATLHGLLALKAPWLVAQAAAVLVYSVLFFVLSKFVVFRRQSPPPSGSGRNK